MDEKIKHSIKAAYKEFEEEPMKEFYDRRIAGYISRLRVRKILKELGSLKNKKVLDVGCEAGYVSMKLLDKNPDSLYAIDICEPALKEFSQKLKKTNYNSKIILKKAFLQDLPFENNLFDIVVCTEVIEHAPYVDKGFKEIHRVMKKGSKLILTFPNEKMRRKVYPIVKMLGVNTDVESEVTLFEYNPKDIMIKLKPYFNIKKYYTIPTRLFPLTNIMICEKK
jgi:ubiquinone/menaquinone biosynthesis C-methylase UbiE